MDIEIKTPFIKLQAFLKFAGACETGGAAKQAVQNGQVSVNSQTCQIPGKKLVPGDKVSYQGEKYTVTAHGD